MGLDLKQVFKLKQAWDSFSRNHPKVPGFISGVQSKGLEERMEIAVAVRYPDGTEFKTGIRVTESDLAILQDLKSMAGGQER